MALRKVRPQGVVTVRHSTRSGPIASSPLRPASGLGRALGSGAEARVTEAASCGKLKDYLTLLETEAAA